MFDLRGFLAIRDEPVVIAEITASELLHGCHRATEALESLQIKISRACVRTRAIRRSA